MHYFFDQVQVIIAEVQTRMGIVKHIARGIVDIPYIVVNRVARDNRHGRIGDRIGDITFVFVGGCGEDGDSRIILPGVGRIDD